MHQGKKYKKIRKIPFPPVCIYLHRYITHKECTITRNYATICKHAYVWPEDSRSPRGQEDIDGLVQHCNISIANALEILQSCTNHRYKSMPKTTWVFALCNSTYTPETLVDETLCKYVWKLLFRVTDDMDIESTSLLSDSLYLYIFR